MTISAQKTESLTIFKKSRQCKNLEEEVRDQATKDSINSEFVRDIIWRNKHMSIKSKVRMYKTCVRPIMTHTAETRADSTISMRILRTTEMKTLKAITGNLLRDRRRNKEIRKECETHDVDEVLIRRRKCSLCKANHNASECEHLAKVKPEERRKIVELTMMSRTED
ncbi:hypothetical protein M0804_014702 [Polistes exclamans]|nr:hypothetical protein M0804_014702 [Polistes exclamans]